MLREGQQSRSHLLAMGAAFMMAVAAMGCEDPGAPEGFEGAFALVLDFIVTLAEKRLMVWQPRQGETERI